MPCKFKIDKISLLEDLNKDILEYLCHYLSEIDIYVLSKLTSKSLTEKFGKIKFNSVDLSFNEAEKIAKESEHAKKSISILVGPNNVHDILDSLDLDH